MRKYDPIEHEETYTGEIEIGGESYLIEIDFTYEIEAEPIITGMGLWHFRKNQEVTTEMDKALEAFPMPSEEDLIESIF